MKHFILTLTLSVILTVFATASELFPFVISFDTPQNVSNVSAWNTPAGADGFIRVDNGQFVNDKGRVRFWGTNTCFAANFLPYELADRMASRLARFGINCVRLHHMDSYSIFPEGGSKTRMSLDPNQLDKLDYYVAALKKNGVYVNLNLHVSRSLDERDGFPKYEAGPSYQKGVDNFYRPIIDANKEYARQLLTHVNKYTGNAYKDEPAVAMIEINNENSVICMWGGWGGLDKIRGDYLNDFQKQWNRWLANKYKTDAVLQKTWNLRSVPLSAELLTSSNFDNGYIPDYKGWAWERDNKTDAPITNKDGIIMATVNKKGEVDWHPQLIGSGFAVKKGELYTLTVRAKADKGTTLSVGVRMNHEPWDGLGFDSQLALNNDWQTFTFNVLPTMSDDNTRLSIGGFREGTTYEFDSVSFKQGGNLGLPEGCSIANANIPVIWKNNTGSFTQQAIDDFCDFLFDIEAKYWDEMYRFLKDDLKVRQPVSGTQLEYGSALAQAKMDYCDIHSYWNHPAFPNRAWDMNDWYLRNRSLVNYVDRDILANLATKRIAGKPFTCSEFNAPYPNQYAAEALPMLAAFGAFQNWDGFFPFAYSHSDKPEPQMATSFFDTAGNTVQMAHMIACRALFESNVVTDTEIVANLDATTERTIFKKDRHQYNIGFTGLGIDKRVALTNRVSLEVFDKTRKTSTIPIVEKNEKYFNVENKTFSMCYDLRTEGKGFMYANSDRAGLFTGFIQRYESYPIYKGKDRQSHWEFKFGETNQNWATATVTNVGQSKTKSNYLVVVTGEMKNSEMQLKALGDDRVTLGNQWGKPPVLCEGVPATITIREKPENIKAYSLDESGNRKQQLEVIPVKTGASIDLKPEYKTIWYEIEMQ